MSKIIERVSGSGQVHADGSPAFNADFEFTLSSRDDDFVPAMGGGLPVRDDTRNFTGRVRPSDGTDQFHATYELSGKALTVTLPDGRVIHFVYTFRDWDVSLVGQWPAKK